MLKKLIGKKLRGMFKLSFYVISHGIKHKTHKTSLRDLGLIFAGVLSTSKNLAHLFGHGHRWFCVYVCFGDARFRLFCGMQCFLFLVIRGVTIFQQYILQITVAVYKTLYIKMDYV